MGSGENAYTLVENSYTYGLWLLDAETYGNGQQWHYTYTDYNDTESRYTLTSDTTAIEFRYFYNSEGAVARIEQYDSAVSDGVITGRSLVAAQRYYYDSSERLSRMTESGASGELTHDYRWTYDHNDNVAKLVETVGDETFTYEFRYNDDQIATGVDYGSTKQTITYDGYGRASAVEITNNNVQKLNITYTYNIVTEGETRYATNQIGTYTNSYGGADHTLTYTYDANGNIISVSDGTNTTTYTYDSLNQLTAEYNEAEGKSWVYTYDTGGNILTKTEYPNATATGEGTVINYGYADANWGDLLTSYNGNEITYDGSGNPLSMNGWTFIWQGGRQLAGMSNGTTSLAFTYNDNGLRTSKTVGSVTHNYTYQGSTLVADKTATDAMYFHYDQNGSVIGFTYDNGTTTAEYYYVKNLQGDILGILDASGALVASYTYDAWGNILTVDGSNSALSNRNPIRYRGYYYDIESELYYLQSRYYDAEVGRFICADSLLSTGQGLIGYTMFVYCVNNPLIYIDIGGADAIWIQEGFSAGWQGHSGLIVQDGTGDWHYFYWGASVGGLDMLAFEDANYIFEKIDTEGHDLTTVKGVRSAVENSLNGKISERAEKVTGIQYFSGDYSNTFDYLSGLDDNCPNYNLILNNCVQQVYHALGKSDERFTRGMPLHPNITFAEMKCWDSFLKNIRVC